MEWNTQIEKVISEQGEQCLSYSWLHDRSQKKYNRLDVWVNVPVIIISSAVGSASIGSESLFAGFEKASVILGVLSIFVAILNTLGSYFAWGKRSEGHRISSIQFSKIYNFIKIELSLPRNQRLAIEEFLKLIKEQLERLKEISPQIPDDIINDYKFKFNSYMDVSKPEICNGLSKVEVYSPVLESKRASMEITDLRLPEPIPLVENIKESKIPKPSWK
jgi:hypothetical protein